MTRGLTIPSRDEYWTLVERLGRGGEAETWHARRASRLFTDDVCVKIPHGVPDADRRRAIIEEARVMSRVRHANVASLLDVVEDDYARPILVIELVRGADLRRVARYLVERKRRIPLEPIAAIGAAVSRALDVAGRALSGGLVHRDVTPDNVLLSLEGEIKLADFGVTRALDRGSWTKSGRLKGKCAYFAPEAVRGLSLTPHADVFSLGVVLFELCAGRRPFNARGLVEQIDALISNERDALAPLARHLPAQLVELVEQMLAVEPRDRPTLGELARAFGALSNDAHAASKWIADAVRCTRGPGLVRARSSDARELGERESASMSEEPRTLVDPKRRRKHRER